MGATSSLANTTSSLTRSDTLNSTDLSNRKSSRNFASTIKKRFSSKKTRRFLKQLDYGKICREFLSTWSTDNLIQLVNDYETNSIIKDFHLQAELARPTVSNVSQDLRKLYDSADCADVYIEFKGEQFPVHKSIVCKRCPLFRELLGKIYTFGTVVPIQIDIAEITTDLFSNLLRYLYSGELESYAGDKADDYKQLLANLSRHVPNELEFDLKHLLDTGVFSDVKLVFKNSTSSNCGDRCNHNAGSHNLTYGSSATQSTKNLTYNSPAALNHSPSKSTTTKQSQQGGSTTNDRKCSACANQSSEYSCHAAVLASRSRFFRNLILRYQAKNGSKGEHQTVNTSKQSIRIVLDEEYIKRRYINVVLNVIYCDATTNLLNLLPNCVCKCRTTNSLANFASNLTSMEAAQETNSFNSSFSNTSNLFNNTQTIFQTISNTISPATDQATKAEYYIDEIIDLFVIGKFLELDTLISICEHLLVDSINLDTVSRLLDWSEKSNGSEFVRRQCLCFLREEFSTIATSPVLLQLNENQLIELIKSDFLQASEDEVLRAVLKWSKFKLEQAFGQSNGCVNSSTNGSPMTGAQRSMENLTDEEQRDQVKELNSRLIKHLRVQHILPLENDLLKSALKNELNDLISTLPPYMQLNDEQTLSCERGIMAWINLENRSNFVKPRFFQPFYEEARTLLDERLSRCEEINFNEKISIKKPFNMPDNLYMVDDGLSNSLNKVNLHLSSATSLNKSTTADLDLNGDRTMIKKLKERFLINKLQIDLDYLNKETKNLIREKSTELYLKVLSSIRQLNLEEKYEILIYIQLRVLREHNLPDEMLFIFEQDEPEYATREKKICLNMNLKRRSLNKNRKFSINSIDLENFLSYDVNGDGHLETGSNQSERFSQPDNASQANRPNRSDLQNCDLQNGDHRKNCDEQSSTNQPGEDDVRPSDELHQTNQLNNSFNQLNQTNQLNNSFNQLNQSGYSQEQADVQSNQMNDLIQYNTYDETDIGLQEKEISLDVFI